MPDLEEVREARKEVSKDKENYCPFGCPSEALDEFGYCEHLIGFVNEGEEKYEPLLHHANDAEKTGPRSVQPGVKGRNCKSVLSTDVLVNPSTGPQNVNGAIMEGKRWVSSRVYRREESQKKKSA